jgi:hypothetical protein
MSRYNAKAKKDHFDPYKTEFGCRPERSRERYAESNSICRKISHDSFLDYMSNQTDVASLPGSLGTGHVAAHPARIHIDAAARGPSMLFNRFKVGARIYLGFGLLLAFGVGVSGFGAFEFSRVDHYVGKMSNLVGNMQRVLDAADALEAVRRAQRSFDVARNPESAAL